MRFETGPKHKKIHEFRIFKEVLPYIKDGTKTHEIRVAYKIFQDVAVGDIIDFGYGVTKTVTTIERFDSPESCIENLGVEAFLPGQDKNDLLTIWHSKIDPGGNYKKLGILAFKLN